MSFMERLRGDRTGRWCGSECFVSARDQNICASKHRSDAGLCRVAASSNRNLKRTAKTPVWRAFRRQGCCRPKARQITSVRCRELNCSVASKVLSHHFGNHEGTANRARIGSPALQVRISRRLPSRSVRTFRQVVATSLLRSTNHLETL